MLVSRHYIHYETPEPHVHIVRPNSATHTARPSVMGDSWSAPLPITTPKIGIV